MIFLGDRQAGAEAPAKLSVGENCGGFGVNDDAIFREQTRRVGQNAVERHRLASRYAPTPPCSGEVVFANFEPTDWEMRNSDEIVVANFSRNDTIFHKNPSARRRSQSANFGRGRSAHAESLWRCKATSEAILAESPNFVNESFPKAAAA